MQLFDYEKQHIDLLRGSLAECTLFLKRNDRFPLSMPGKIAAYGNGVRHTIKGGTGSGEVNSRYFVSVEEGLRAAGFTITTNNWLDAYDRKLAQAKEQFVRDIKAAARKKHTIALMECMGVIMPEPEYDLPLDGEGDTAIYVLSRISGEGADREPVSGDILLTGTEKRTILKLQEQYPNFLLVLNVGGVVDLSGLESVSNILLLSQLGVETGSVLADILLGKANPSGKLSTTWTAWQDYCTIGEFGDKDETRYKEGIYVGYRYFDAVGKKPLYPFGFGLSYTEFKQEVISVSAQKDIITLTAKSTNVGSYAGKDVLFAFVSAPVGKLDKPYQDLAGWTKTKLLQPGESTEVSITFSLSDLASYDEAGASYLLEKGNYVLRLGKDSRDTTIAALLKLDADVIVRKVRNCLGKPDFTDWVPNRHVSDESSERVVSLSAAEFETASIDFNSVYDIDEEIRSLTDEELAYMNIGSFSAKGIGSVIGNGSSLLAGGAGETTRMLENKGFPVLLMADGPAGLRLAQKFYRDELGAHAIGGSAFPESMLPFVPGILKLLLPLLTGSSKPKKGQNIEYQYATAIPIGTAIAQSFNIELAEAYGDIVGTEMERFGVDLWLAPALNIHRDIRCGRNFEYYSEDPLVSGKIAAALTRGVQKHPGCGTTIKHYAANNQETNRYCNNSQVSERAMREIYLRGFGICVREAQPHAVMTSYNLLNGVHTSEHRGLIEDILRCEYGFRGIVMTDWILAMTEDKTSFHRMPIASEIAAAGGDIIMPGCKADYENLLTALKEGRISKTQLQINVTRVYRKAKELA